MTYWAREDPDGPWLESEVLVGATAVELRPLVGSVPSRLVDFDTLARVEDVGDDRDPTTRTVRVTSTDGTAVQVRGPVKGVGALVAAMQHVPPGGPPAAAPAPPGAVAPGSVEESVAPVAVPVPPPPPAVVVPSGEFDVAPAAPPGPDPDRVGWGAVAATMTEPVGDDTGPDAEVRGSGPARMIPAAIGVLVFVVALGFWNYRSNQQDLTEASERRPERTARTEGAAVTEVPAQVEGATTVPSAPQPSTTAPPATTPTTTAPTTSTTKAPTTTVAAAKGHTLSGTVAVQQAQHWDGIAPACRGLGQLSDVTTGAPVTVQDASGRTVATGNLGACTFVVPGSELREGAPVVARDGATGGYPRFDFQVAGLPESERYSVRVGRYDPVELRRDAFGSGSWHMRMVITAS